MTCSCERQTDAQKVARGGGPGRGRTGPAAVHRGVRSRQHPEREQPRRRRTDRAPAPRGARSPGAASHEFMAQSRMQLCAAGYANVCKLHCPSVGPDASRVKGWGKGRNIASALWLLKAVETRRGVGGWGSSSLSWWSRPRILPVSWDERMIPSLSPTTWAQCPPGQGAERRLLTVKVPSPPGGRASSLHREQEARQGSE